MNSIKSMLWYNSCAMVILMISNEFYLMAAVLFIMNVLNLFSKEEA